METPGIALVYGELPFPTDFMQAIKGIAARLSDLHDFELAAQVGGAAADRPSDSVDDPLQTIILTAGYRTRSC